MRLIDADALEGLLSNAIQIQETMAKQLGIEDDDGVQMELKAYRDILNGVKEQPTIEQDDAQYEIEERKNICRVLFNRCFTMYGGQMCQFCNMTDRCDKERSVMNDTKEERSNT